MGVLILLGLLGIAVTVWIIGQHEAQDRFVPDAKALAATEEAIPGRPGTLSEDGKQAETRPGPLEGFDGVVAMGAVETYTPTTLYEKINGRAPTYDAFNFRELLARSFSIPGHAGQFVDVYLYRMDSPLNAFGIYSLENQEPGESLGFVSDGMRGPMGLFFRRGSTYVQISASEASASVMDPAESIARSLTRSLPHDNRGMEARDLLPPDNMKPGTLAYTSANAFGQAVLSNVFQAVYMENGQEIPYFSMHAASPGSGRHAWKELQNFFSRYGTVHQSWGAANGAVISDVFAAEIFGQWSIIFLRERDVGGVMNAEDRDAARAWIDRLLGPEVPAYE